MLTAICSVGVAIGVFGIVDGVRRYRKDMKDWDAIINTLDEMQFKEAFPCPEFDSNGLIINWGGVTNEL